MPIYHRINLMSVMALLILLLTMSCSEKTENQGSLVKPAGTASSSAKTDIAVAPAFRKKPVLYVVDSYNPATFEWTREINAGIVQGLEKGGLKKDMDYRMFSATIDAYVNESPDKMEAQGNRILEDIRIKKPDLVLTTDDDALVWVGLKIDDVPVVFNGINGDPRKYLSSSKIDTLEKPGNNITGVYQTTYFHQSLALIKKLVPSARTFGVMTDTTTTGKILLESLEKIDAGSLPLQWKETLVSDQFPKWKETLSAWRGQVDAVFILSANAVYDKQGKLMTSDHAVGWIADNSSIPETSCWAYQVKDGILASATDDGVKQGQFSAMLALKILEGAAPGDLAITTPPDGVPAINLARAKKLEITVPQELMSLLIEDGVIFK